MRSVRVALVIALSLVAVAFPTEPVVASPSSVTLGLSRWTSGFSNPVALAYPPSGGRTMIVEQRGVIKARHPSTGQVWTFLDIRNRVLYSGEQGLLGLAFPSNFASTGYFFVYYTSRDGNNKVTRFQANPTGESHIDPATERLILTIPHPTYTNHDGGQLQFGLDRYLYIATGDGGGGGGPNGYAQSTASLLGKILRIDVSRSCGSLRYCIPSGNPYAGRSGAKYEIWNLGLRNPWRFSFDRVSGHLFVADVGQGAWEEIDVSSNRPGTNWGWDCYEGNANTIATYGGSYCSGRTFSKPVHVYDHSNDRCAIIGGYRYRGSQYPAMTLMYVFADYCSMEMWLMQLTSNGWVVARKRVHTANPTSFGQSTTGELFMVDTAGVLYKLVAS